MDRVGRFPYTSRLTAQAGYAQVAQLVEQRIENPRVAGSIPALGTIVNQKYRFCGLRGSGSAFRPYSSPPAFASAARG
jgi:hypothetical protein